MEYGFEPSPTQSSSIFSSIVAQSFPTTATNVDAVFNEPRDEGIKRWAVSRGSMKNDFLSVWHD